MEQVPIFYGGLLKGLRKTKGLFDKISDNTEKIYQFLCSASYMYN